MNITNIIDVLIVLTILMMGAIGFQKGVLKQTVSTVGFILVVVLAFYLKNPIAEFLSLYLPFFKFGGTFAGVTALNILLYQLIAFVIVIIILEAILQVIIKITGIIEKILKFTIILGIPSKLLGLLVGFVEGFIVVFIVLFFLKQPAFHLSIFDNSKLTDNILNSTPILSQVAGGFVETFQDISDIGERYTEQGVSENTLNLETIDVMLKHNVITVRYVEKLLDAKKMEVMGVDTVLNKYR